MTDKTSKNPKRPETKPTDNIARAWLISHGHEKKIQKVEAEERAKKLNPIKQAAHRKARK